MMMTERQIIELIDKRIEIAEGQCNRGWFDNNDGVFRGLLWALTGNDPGCHLTSRVQDIYELMGCKTKRVGDHFHYALPWEPEETINQCELCDKAEGIIS